MISSKRGFLGADEVRWRQGRLWDSWKTCADNFCSQRSSTNTSIFFPPCNPATIPSPGSLWWGNRSCMFSLLKNRAIQNVFRFEIQLRCIYQDTSMRAALWWFKLTKSGGKKSQKGNNLRHIFLESPQLLGSRNSGIAVFRRNKAIGKIGKGLTIEKWKEKDLSTCVLSGDPECALEKGTVGKRGKLFYVATAGQWSTCCLFVWSRALLHDSWGPEGSQAG